MISGESIVNFYGEFFPMKKGENPEYEIFKNFF